MPSSDFKTASSGCPGALAARHLEFNSLLSVDGDMEPGHEAPSLEYLAMMHGAGIRRCEKCKTPTANRGGKCTRCLGGRKKAQPKGGKK